MKSKRDIIMSTPEFIEWRKWRETVEPIPEDLYRAFMIDLSLYASLRNKDDWKKMVNRGDMADIDYPKALRRVRRLLKRRKR